MDATRVKTQNAMPHAGYIAQWLTLFCQICGPDIPDKICTKKRNSCPSKMSILHSRSTECNFGEKSRHKATLLEIPATDLLLCSIRFPCTCIYSLQVDSANPPGVQTCQHHIYQPIPERVHTQAPIHPYTQTHNMVAC